MSIIVIDAIDITWKDILSFAFSAWRFFNYNNAELTMCLGTIVSSKHDWIVWNRITAKDSLIQNSENETSWNDFTTILNCNTWYLHFQKHGTSEAVLVTMFPILGKNGDKNGWVPSVYGNSELEAAMEVVLATNIQKLDKSTWSMLEMMEHY